MPKTFSTEIPYGPVWIKGGPHKGRIGIYDDQDYNLECECEDAIVYFGDTQLVPGYSIIPMGYIAEVTTHALIERRNILFDSVTNLKKSPLKGERRARALEELNLIEGILANRMISARLTNASKGSKVFISHSSKDKQLARWISVDLKNAGHQVWFDEWNIKVGESIPKRSVMAWIPVISSRSSFPVTRSSRDGSKTNGTQNIGMKSRPIGSWCYRYSKRIVRFHRFLGQEDMLTFAPTTRKDSKT